AEGGPGAARREGVRASPHPPTPSPKEGEGERKFTIRRMASSPLVFLPLSLPGRGGRGVRGRPSPTPRTHPMKRLSLSLMALILAAPAVRADRDDAVVHLFNGKDLSNFYTWLGAPAKGEKPYGKNNDPKKVFTVKDGMIHISGEVFGAL